MKQTISILLVLVMALSLCACGNTSNAGKSKYVGVWEDLLVDKDSFEFQYMYVYEDGTGDILMKPTRLELAHANAFTWRVEDGYFVRESNLTHGIVKFKLDGDYLLDSQGKQKYKLYSKNTAEDVAH